MHIKVLVYHLIADNLSFNLFVPFKQYIYICNQMFNVFEKISHQLLNLLFFINFNKNTKFKIIPIKSNLIFLNCY